MLMFQTRAHIWFRSRALRPLKPPLVIVFKCKWEIQQAYLPRATGSCLSKYLNMLILQTISRTHPASPNGMLKVANSWSKFFAYDEAMNEPPKRNPAGIAAFRSPYFTVIHVPRQAKMLRIHNGIEPTHAAKKDANCYLEKSDIHQEQGNLSHMHFGCHGRDVLVQ